MRIFILVSLSIMLSTSSFFLVAHLKALITSDSFNDEQLKLAEKYQIISAQYVGFNRQEVHSANWFRYAFELGKNDAEIANQLANYYMEKAHLEQGKHWLIQANKLGSISAAIKLAKLYQEKGNIELALQLLSVHKGEEQAQVERLKLLLSAERLKEVRKEVTRLSGRGPLNSLLSDFSNYAVLNHKDFPAKRCTRQIQPVATEWEGLKHLENLVDEFNQHALSEYFCIDPPRYIKVSELGCYHRNKQAIQCNDKQLQHLMLASNADYILAAVPKGGANVYQGVAYIDYHDGIDVLTHELTHFLGFVDEYELSSEHLFCQSESIKSINVVKLKKFYVGKREEVRARILAELPWKHKIGDNTAILQPANVKNTKWLVGSPTTVASNEAGVFRAKTCDTADFVTFKPFRQRTALEYFETPLPHLYLSLIDTHGKYAMPTFKSFQY